MAIEKVKQFFKTVGMQEKILEFDTSAATVELAAKSIGCLPKQIAKTLSFQVEDKCILIVVAGDAKVDNAKFREVFHQKAQMLRPELVEESVGHAIGGVCPFAIPEDVKVYLDISLKRFKQIYPSAGSSNSAICLTLPELEQYSHFVSYIDVCKNWNMIEE